MAIASRPYRPAADRQPALHQFAVAHAATHERYDYLTHFRLDLLLTSRVWEPERDVRVWCDNTSGHLVGFALLWRRSRERPEVTLESVADPDAGPRDFDTRVLRWARRRSAALARELGHAVSLIAMVGENEHARAE